MAAPAKTAKSKSAKAKTKAKTKVKPKAKSSAKPKANAKPKTKSKAKPKRAGSARKRPAAAKKKAATARRDQDAPRKKAAAEPARTGVKNTPMIVALKAEHRHMANVMKLYEEQLGAIERGELVDPHVVYEIMEYMVTWPDRYHHPREDIIYSRVAELDGQAADEVDTLQRDHDRTAENGKEMLHSIERWRAGAVSGELIVDKGRAYIAHIHEHMNLEEQLVFPHIERVLSVQDWRELAEDDSLQAVAAPIFGPQVQREFRNMARKLRRSIRRTVEQGALTEWVGIDSFMESVEVMSIAFESARDATTDHLRNGFEDAIDIFLESPARSPLRVTMNNTRVGMRILGDMLSISRETVQDLARVNRERQDRLRLLNR